MSNMVDYYERYWNARSEEIPPGHVEWTKQRVSSLLQALSSLPAGSRVLDAGCGSGMFCNLLADHQFRVTGIDLSSVALLRAEPDKHQGVSGYVEASVEGQIPFPNAAFDAIWTTEVLEHLVNVQETFNEFNRLLRDGGLLVFTTPYHGTIKNIMLALHGYDFHYNPTGPHIRFFTQASLNRCLTTAGFTPKQWGGVGRSWPLWMSHFVVAMKTGSPRG